MIKLEQATTRARESLSVPITGPITGLKSWRIIREALTLCKWETPPLGRDRKNYLPVRLENGVWLSGEDAAIRPTAQGSVAVG